MLNDGSNSYLYGLGRIGEQDDLAAWNYHLSDALGSVRQVTDAAGAVLLSQSYQPYGDVLSSNGLVDSNYGFAGEWTDETGLQNLRARYYAPGMGRFMSRDTFQGNFQEPLTLNRWNYVQGNPTNHVDPSGNRECGTPYDPSCSVRPIPDWWTNHRRFYVEGYGVFDKGHIERGHFSAQFFTEQTRMAVEKGGGNFTELARSVGGTFRDDFEVNYWVSENVTLAQIDGVAYGIYMDFEFGYENHQAGRVDFFSAFSPEDFPSDHLGFWAYIKGKQIDEIPGVLESLGQVTPWYGGSLLIDKMFVEQMNGLQVIPLCFPRNYEFMPMVDITTYVDDRVFEVRWQNRPWPSWLEITPIESGPNTWQRVSS